MSLLRFLLIVAAFVSFWAAPLACAEEEIRFSIITERPESKLAEKMEVRLRLRNEGKAPVVVNTRFKLGTPQGKPDQREVALEAVSGPGDKVPLKFSDYETGLPKSDDFKLLAPGEEITSERAWDLKALFDFKAPGAYRVRATYQNTFGKELGLEVFRGKLPAELEIQLTE